VRGTLGATMWASHGMIPDSGARQPRDGPMQCGTHAANVGGICHLGSRRAPLQPAFCAARLLHHGTRWAVLPRPRQTCSADVDSSRRVHQRGAVFLSYASQDAEAARRICNALRAAGIEVWFDQSELRGGDAWDRQIREQIHHCRLFIPVISANSERRDEGYFRREWSLAADRTRDMTHKRAFLVPVVIDGTPERGASVPEKFHELQWTRLPDGQTSPAFVERIRRLLSPEASSARASRPDPYIHDRAAI